MVILYLFVGLSAILILVWMSVNVLLYELTREEKPFWKWLFGG